MTTHVHAPVLKTKSEIAEQAREFHPVRFTSHLIVNTVAFLITAAGWTVGAAWFAIAFTVLWTMSRIAWTGQCFSAGVRLGARVPVEDKENG